MIQTPDPGTKVRRRFELALVAMTGVAAILIACVPSAPIARTATPVDLKVTATEFKFQTSTPRVVTGQPVVVTFTNAGTTEHNLHVDATGTHLVAQPGQTVTATVIFASAGDYDFVCTIPGHREAGMNTRVVAAATASATSVADARATPISGSVPGALPPSIARVPQGQVAPPVQRTQPALVKVSLQIQQVMGLLADGVAYTYWTFAGSVPGPMVRVRQGDTVELTLLNPPGVEATHSINVHAAVGPGGGAVQVAPGQQNTFRFQATHAGVWVYHCMTPIVGQHVANGMFGLVVVEPPEGLPPVAREYYIMQDDVYLEGNAREPGLHAFSLDKMLAEQPDYVVYNGSVGALNDERALTATVGDTVRFFFGVAGPNLDSALHVVGLAWDRVHPEGAEETLTDVQTTLVPPGGATMTELRLVVPGMYMLEDHHIGRLEKGASGQLHVDGPDNLPVFHQDYPADGPQASPSSGPFTITEEPLPPEPAR